MIEICPQESKAVSIAYQGAEGAFSHEAAMEFAAMIVGKNSCTYKACSSFDEAFQLASSLENNLACLPFENSSIGSIRQNNQLLFQSKLQIIAELFLPVNHQLLALAGSKIEQISKVYSHPVALSQCKRLFEENPHMSPVEYPDTGAAAALVAKSADKSIAAIASSKAAAHYQLETVKEDVQDYAHNQTRFLLLAPDKNRGGSLTGKADKLSYPLKATIGLAEAENLNHLAVITARLNGELELLRIETVSVPRSLFKQALILDLGLKGPEALNSLCTLEAESDFRFFGLYRQADPAIQDRSGQIKIES